MTVFEYGGRLLVVDWGVLFPEPDQSGVDLILPDFTALDGRLDQIEAMVLTHAHEDHIGLWPDLLRERGDIPLIGSRLDTGPSAQQAHRAPDDPGHGRSGRGRTVVIRTVRSGVPRGQPLDPGRTGGRDHHPGRGGAAYRRLQDGPAPAGRPAHRPGRLRAARPGAWTC